MTPRQPATPRQGAKPGEPHGSKDVERKGKENPLPATALRCRNCETDHALEAVGVCSRCWGPLDPVYDREPPAVTREGIEAGPPSIWRYADLLPVAPPAEQRLAPGLTPLVRRRRLAERARRRRALAQARHREPDALVQGPRRRGRDRQGAGARADDARLLVDRQPRERGRRARRRRGARGRRLLPRRPRAGEADRDRRLRRDALRGRGHLRRLQPADDRALVRARLGRSSTSACAATTPKARRRSRTRSPSSSAGSTPDVVVSPIASGSLYTKLNQGVHASCSSSGSSTGAAPRLIGGQAGGLLAGRDRVRDGEPRPAGAAGHGRALARDRQPRRRRPRRRDRARDGRRPIHAVAGGGGRRVHGAARRDDGRVRRDGRRA